METISLTSKVLHRLGSFFIGTPESLRMDPDFYFDMGDRIQPEQRAIRDKEVLRGKIGTNVYRLSQTYRVGPIVSVAAFVVILGLSFLSGVVTKSAEGVKSKWEQHVAAVTQQNQADAAQAMGNSDQTTCAAQLDAINNLSSEQKAGKDLSDQERVLSNFTGGCVNQGFIAGASPGKGQAMHYHARKFTDASLGVVGPQTCTARLADFNALTATENWRYSVDADAAALNAFRSNCEIRGFIHAADSSGQHPIYH